MIYFLPLLQTHQKRSPKYVESSSEEETQYESEEQEEVTETPAPNIISDYEKQVQQNIEERKKIFEMLKLGDAKEELAHVLMASKENQPKASGRGFKRKKEE